MLLSIQEQDWAAVLSLIEQAIDVEGSARASGALVRKRQIRSGSDLLRLALAYGPGGQSLRQTAAWAELQQLASMSDVALLYRLRDSADWLAQIASALLAKREPTTAKTLGLRLRVIDGSIISPPGHGPRWRLHCLYDLAEERLGAFELTGARTAEALERASIGPGDLVMGDRVYARPGGLHHIAEAGGEYLVRAGRRSLRLTDVDHRPLDLATVLDRSDRDGSCDLDVFVLDGSGERKPLPSRLVLIKKPPEAAERARKRALRESQRGGHKNDPLSLRCAEHLMLVTSLDREKAGAEQLGGLYRLRWRIELAFKRLKSLLSLDRLPAKDEGLARTWILAHLIAALLIEDLSPELRDSPP
jgi:Transposase DDE domain